MLGHVVALAGRVGECGAEEETDLACPVGGELVVDAAPEVVQLVLSDNTRSRLPS